MELLDLPELYKAFPAVSYFNLKSDLVPDSDIDMINNTLSELSGEIISVNDHCLVLSTIDGKYVYIIHPTFRLTEIVIYENCIGVYVPEDLFLKMAKLDCLVKLPYNYFCYIYEDGTTLESTLKRIRDYGIS